MNKKEKKNDWPERLPGESLITYIDRTTSNTFTYMQFSNMTEEEKKEMRDAFFSPPFSNKVGGASPMFITPKMHKELTNWYKGQNIFKDDK